MVASQARKKGGGKRRGRERERERDKKHRRRRRRRRNHVCKLRMWLAPMGQKDLRLLWSTRAKVAGCSHPLWTRSGVLEDCLLSCNSPSTRPLWTRASPSTGNRDKPPFNGAIRGHRGWALTEEKQTREIACGTECHSPHGNLGNHNSEKAK